MLQHLGVEGGGREPRGSGSMKDWETLCFGNQVTQLSRGGKAEQETEFG